MFSNALVVEKFILEIALAKVLLKSGHELFTSGTHFARLRLKKPKQSIRGTYQIVAAIKHTTWVLSE
jgi:hypothetical protein